MARFTLLLCFGIVVLGAFVRLSDAGLGCPDWPGCYGQLLVPDQVHEANAAYPERPLEAAKAWKEMIHRYFASGLGLLIVALAVFGWNKGLPRKMLLGLVALVIFQGILGMWTVTWQLKPLAVTSHLLGGMSTLGMLAWLNMLLRPAPNARGLAALRGMALVGLLVLVGQIFLGGWTSSNYAALACPDFPTCHGQLWPESNFSEAFVLWHGLDINFEYGILDSPARTAIHLTHRIGALVTTLVLLALALAIWRRTQARGLAVLLLTGLLFQISLGIASVKFGLPLAVAAAHNAGAAFLVLIMVLINVQARRERPLPRGVVEQVA
ncbi:MAG: COX15/CtaA family protein [Oceanococcus sp.]